MRSDYDPDIDVDQQESDKRYDTGARPQCCPNDYDYDGNCHIHKAPGIRRIPLKIWHEAESDIEQARRERKL